MSEHAKENALQVRVAVVLFIRTVTEEQVP
jgi:hypothetical protein